MDNFTLGGYKHGTALFKGLQNSSLNPNMRQLVSTGSGAVDPTFVSVGQMQPEISFGALAIKDILAELGITGAALSDDKCFLQKMLAGGLRAGAILHFQITMATGMIIPTQITGDQGGEAIITCRVVPTSADGSASPLAIVTNASLEALQDQITQVYTMGDIEINGAALEGIDRWMLDFGIELWINTKSGHVYPTEVGIIKRAPFITATTFDLVKFETWTEIGVVQGVSDSTIKLLDQTEGGARGSAPITFTIDAGTVHFESVEARHGVPASGSVRITPTSDGVADIIAISGIT